MHAMLAVATHVEEYLDQVERDARSFPHLPFHPEKISIWRRPGRLFMSFEVNNPVFLGGCFAATGETAAGFLGVPLVGQLARYIGRYSADDIAKWHSKVGPQGFFDSTGGSYALIRFTEEGLQAQTDLCARYPLFYRKERGCLIVGTIPEMVAKCGPAKRDWTLAGPAARSMAAHGQIWGDETFYPNVKLAAGGSLLTWENRSIVMRNLFDWSAFGEGRSIDPDAYEEAAASMQDNFFAIGKLYAGQINLGLSGGKDSRIMAAYAASGIPKEQLHVFTSGVEGSPEFEIAEAVSKVVDVEHARKVTAGEKLAAPSFRPRLRNQVGRYQAQLFPMAGFGESIGGEGKVSISGFGGELYRRGIAKQFIRLPIKSIRDAQKRWPYYHTGADPARVMTDEANAAFRDWMSNWVSIAVNDGYPLLSLPELFFARYRVPFHQGLGANHTGGVLFIDPLIDPVVARVHMSFGAKAGEMELTHCALLWHASREAARIPFMKAAWHPELNGYFDDVVRDRHGMNHSAQAVRPVPWTYFREAFDEIDDVFFGAGRSGEIYDTFVHKERLREHLRGPEPLSGTGVLPQMFSLLAMQMFAAGEYERPKDRRVTRPVVSNDGGMFLEAAE